MNDIPAFPSSSDRIAEGMSLRDWFAGIMQADDRLVKCIRAMDDTTLPLFAVHPQVEREEWITETGHLSGENVFYGKSEVEKVTIRLQLEANAIAKVRYMQADAMIEARKNNYDTRRTQSCHAGGMEPLS